MTRLPLAAVLLALCAAVASGQAVKPTEVSPADIAKLADKDTTQSEKDSINGRYNGKTVRLTARAGATVTSVMTGEGYVVKAEGKQSGELMVFPASAADFKKIRAAQEGNGKADILIVVEGKAKFPGDLSLPAVIDAKVISLKAVTRK